MDTFISVLNFNTLAKILFSRIVINCAKIPLNWQALKVLDHSDMRRSSGKKLVSL